MFLFCSVCLPTDPVFSSMPCHAIYLYCSTPHRTELYYTAPRPRCRCAIPHCPSPPPLHHSSFIIRSINSSFGISHYLRIIETCYNAFLFIPAPLRAPEHRAPTYPAPPAFSPPLPFPHRLGLSPRTSTPPDFCFFCRVLIPDSEFCLLVLSFYSFTFVF